MEEFETAARTKPNRDHESPGFENPRGGNESPWFEDPGGGSGDSPWFEGLLAESKTKPAGLFEPAIDTATGAKKSEQVKQLNFGDEIWGSTRRLPTAPEF